MNAPADPAVDAAVAVHAARELLLREMKQTKGSRFNAADRLSKRDAARTRLTAYASAMVIVLTVLPAFIPVPGWISGAINLSTVAFSLVILAASLLQTSNADPVRAVQLHNCALDINSLLRKLRGETALTENQLKDYAGRYDAILMRYSVNHESVDYERYKLEHPNEFPELAQGDKKTAEREVRALGLAEVGVKLVTATTLGIFAVVLSTQAPPVVQAIRRFLSEIHIWTQ
jgi:hypothetical protein